LFELVVTSPAAYNHSTLVSCLALTTKQPSSSFSKFKFSTKSTFGIVQTATKIQSAFKVFPDFKITPVIHKASPVISSTSSFVTNSIFSLALAFSTQIFSALKVSLL
jgi:hypothetical protein